MTGSGHESPHGVRGRVEGRAHHFLGHAALAKLETPHGEDVVDLGPSVALGSTRLAICRFSRNPSNCAAPHRDEGKLASERKVVSGIRGWLGHPTTNLISGLVQTTSLPVAG